MTNRSVRVGSVCTLASHDTNAVISSVSAGSVNIGGSSSGFIAVSTEILSIPQPVIYDPNVGYVSNTGCEPSVTVSYGTGSGTLYMVAVPFGDTPSVAQIKAGQRSNGTPAIASQNKTVTSDGTNTFSPVTGLTLGTEYYFWFLQSNGGGDSTPVLATYTPQNYIAQSTSWLSPGSTGADGSYGATFTNHANLKVEDGSYASTTLGASKGAIAFTYNYNANLPAGAVVNGIEVRIKGMMPVADAAVLTQAYLAVDASNVSNPIASSSNVFAPELTTTNTVFVGGSTSGWATTYWGGFGEYGKPNAATVNNSTFGVVATGYNIGATSRTINLDLVQMKVHYLVASGEPVAILSAPGYNSDARYPFVTTDSSTGTIYYVLVPDGDTPSVAQIKLGQKSNGYAAMAWESKSVTSAGVQTFNAIDGMEGEPPYKLWFVHTTASGDSEPLGYSFTPAPSNPPPVLFWAFP
ncbi:hypothetical protein ACOYR4_15470 [Acidovorax sp. M14]|uniref:hypothetical protein n=1 Tax=Acidovorax sp. M14 TaxID=3411354 RepID=UPI003BF5A3F9